MSYTTISESDYSGSTCSMFVRNAIVEFLSHIRFDYSDMGQNGYIIYKAKIARQTLGPERIVKIIVNGNLMRDIPGTLQVDKSTPITIVQFLDSPIESKMIGQDFYKNVSAIRHIMYTMSSKTKNYQEYTGPDDTILRLYGNPKINSSEQYPNVANLGCMITAYKCLLYICV